MSGRDQRQQVVAKWAAEAFGIEQATSLPQRGVRLLEEAVEAAQSAGTSREMAHKLVDYVFDRPAGQLGQEIGGVSVTLLALAAAAALSADEEEQREISRILSKPIDHYTKRNQAKNDAGFLAADGAPEAPRMLKPSDLPAGDTLIDYGKGWFGPLMFHWLVEGIDAERVAREAGYEVKQLYLFEDGPNEQLHDDYSEYGDDSVIVKWQPTSPGDGWKLIGKDDTEDGPVATFVRPLPKQELAHG